jgi:hypothetical protein
MTGTSKPLVLENDWHQETTGARKPLVLGSNRY